MSAPLRIAFLTTLGVNVGDEFIREGIRACLDRLPLSYTPLFVNKHDRASLFEPHDNETVLTSDKLRQSDVIIQSGAPVYWWFGPAVKSTTVDWHEWVWLDRILPAGPAAPLFLNLGAGSCQKWDDDGESFVRDPECAAFASQATQRAVLTVVRDPVAGRILARLGLPHESLPCPAFLAAARFVFPRPEPSLIGVNLMPLGGHHQLDEAFQSRRWVYEISRLVHEIRKMGSLVFVCHNQEEADFSQLFASPGERIFLSSNYRDYLDLFPRLTAIFANRVHAAVAAAGFGVPAVIAGTDTRATIGSWIGLPIFRSATLDHAEVAHQLAGLLRERRTEQDRLRSLHAATLDSYLSLLQPALATAAPRPAATPASPEPETDLVLRWLELHPEDRDWPLQFALRPFWFIPERGVNHPELYQGSPLRWTTRRAEFLIPAPLARGLGELQLGLWPVHPAGHPFSIKVNGQSILTAQATPEGWAGSASFPPAEELLIELETVPLDSPDARELGIALRRFSLQPVTQVA